MKKLTKGILIAVEGIDGSGKSTFVAQLAHVLEKEFAVLVTKEPGDNSLGRPVRKILQEQNLLEMFHSK